MSAFLNGSNVMFHDAASVFRAASFKSIDQLGVFVHCTF
jgi:hypothetical protein